jgi:hypothetical protein
VREARRGVSEGTNKGPVLSPKKSVSGHQSSQGVRGWAEIQGRKTRSSRRTGEQGQQDANSLVGATGTGRLQRQ